MLHKFPFIFILLLPLIGGSLPVATQDEKIIFNGMVLDSDTNEPVPFASIFIEKYGVYRFCEEDGSFSFTLQLKSNSPISISAMGYKTLTLTLKELNGKLKLTRQVEELNEVIVIAESRTTPKEVITKLIKQKKNNYATQAFNQKRYSQVTIAEQDAITLDFEVINDEYHQGYHKLYGSSQKVEQIKWNVGDYKSSIYKTAWNIAGEGRTDQVQYAAFLKRGKYKNFDYQFVSSVELHDPNIYVIDYKPRKFSWKYTQFDHSIYHSNAKIQSFRGRIYVRKTDFVVLKVEEEWLANIKEVFDDGLGSRYRQRTVSDSLWVPTKDQMVYNVRDYKVSNKEVFEYEMEKDGLNYPSSYSKIMKIAYIDVNGEPYNGTLTQKARYLDVRTEDINSYPFEGWKTPKKYSALNRVKYDPKFWQNFLKKELED